MTKTTLLAALATAAVVGGASLSGAHADTILTFGQIGTANTTTITDNFTSPASTTITVTTAVTITQIDPKSGILTPVTATLTFTANSLPGTTSIDSSGLFSEDFSGTFSITSGPIDYLSGSFTDTVDGTNGGTGGNLTTSQPPDSVSFTSSVIPAADLAVPRNISLSFTNFLPSFGGSGICPSPITDSTTCTLGSGTASIAGNFSAFATPLPAALPLFGTGLGMLGLLGWRRKRKSSASLLGAA